MSPVRSFSIRSLIALIAVLSLAFALPAQDKEINKKKAKPAAEQKSAQPSTEKAEAKAEPDAEDSDKDEAKGPWHGLSYRLIGPFRGGRALAVSGVIGDSHTDYFGEVRGRRRQTNADRRSRRPVGEHAKR